VSDPEIQAQVQTLLARIAELDAAQSNHDEIVALSKEVRFLTQMLVARGVISLDDEKALHQLGKVRSRPTVRLAVFDDKRAVKSPPDLDCSKHMHLCHGRCCLMKINLATEDLAERKLDWDVYEPYYLAKAADGYCKYQHETTGACTVYEDRPAVCRVYDCRKDPQVWEDFENQIPAPFALLGTGCVQRDFK
jgi:Fe-S-cluster containining protein